jgi:hypothetical protein
LGGNERFSGRIQRDGRAVFGEVNAALDANGTEWRLKPSFHSLEFFLHTLRVVHVPEVLTALCGKRSTILNKYRKIFVKIP